MPFYLCPFFQDRTFGGKTKTLIQCRYTEGGEVVQGGRKCTCDWTTDRIFGGVNEANDVAKHIFLVACRYFSRCRLYRKHRLYQYSTHLYTRSQEGCKLTDAAVTFRYS
jgi:hypothetical protein